MVCKVLILITIVNVPVNRQILLGIYSAIKGVPEKKALSDF